MSASFGVLKDRTLELDPGLNVIESPNESGKTTWCAFLRAMLYGPDSRRSREGKRLERQYSPWDGSPMWGEMELNWAGKEITLRRGDSPSGPMRAVRAVYTGTDVTVPELTGPDAGELLTGLSAEVFARTAFIGPAGLGVEQSAELEKKIAALVTTGEEGSTFSQASEALRSLQRRCRYRGKGLLPGLEQEMTEVSEALEQLRDAASRLEDAELREEELKEELAKSSGARDAEKEYLAAGQQAVDLEQDMLGREREAARLEAELRRGPLWGREPGESGYRAMRADHRRARELERAARELPGKYRAWPIPLLLGVLAAAGGFFVPWLLMAAGLGLAAAAWLFFAGRNRGGRTRRELERLLNKYGAENAGDIPRRYEKYTARWRESRALRSAAEELRTRVDAARARAEALRERAESAADPEKEKELRALAETRARLRGRLEAMGDPAAMESRLDCLREEHRRLEGKYAALETALAELEAADGEMHSRFAPALSRAAEVIFRQLTGGRYDALAFDRDLSAAARAADSPRLREEESLSRGTRDQLYLSLRLALCELTAGEEPCPIVLDDALLTFDDERLGCAMEYLRELSERRQILLFTCQNRENRYLKSMGEV